MEHGEGGARQGKALEQVGQGRRQVASEAGKALTWHGMAWEADGTGIRQMQTRGRLSQMVKVDSGATMPSARVGMEYVSSTGYSPFFRRFLR